MHSNNTPNPKLALKIETVRIATQSILKLADLLTAESDEKFAKISKELADVLDSVSMAIKH